jgi:ATP-dependent DNA helicase RecG
MAHNEGSASVLPIGVEDVLGARSVESDRLEFKTGWNPDAIYRSICAFANDITNIGGGYIIIGAAEAQGVAQRPVVGLSPATIATIQKEMIGLNTLMEPYYAPVVSIEEVDGRQILVIWAPGGDHRPYRVPESVLAKKKRHAYYIRRYASTIEAKAQDLKELIGMANQVPFDDRPNSNGHMEDIKPVYVQDFLGRSHSKLFEAIGVIPFSEIVERMGIITGLPESRKLRNIALMVFSREPERFFPCSYIDLVHFRGESADRSFVEKRFTGPMHIQVGQALEYLGSVVVFRKVIKVLGKAESIRVYNYPFNVLEEALVNAVYHRNYETYEPITVRIAKDCIMIQSCDGPDRSIDLRELQDGIAIPGRYRNRRLGDFLKELGLAEGRATGFALMKRELERNGSPPLSIETDDNRSFFRVVFKIHPLCLEDVAQGSLAQAVLGIDDGPGPDDIVAVRLAALRYSDAGKEADGANEVSEGPKHGGYGDDTDDTDDKDDTDDTDDNPPPLPAPMSRDSHTTQGALYHATDSDLLLMSEMLLFCRAAPKSLEEILWHVRAELDESSQRRYIGPLVDAGLLESYKPGGTTAGNGQQRYRLTERGLLVIAME